MTITRFTPIDQLPEFLRVEEFAIMTGIGKGLAYAQARSGAIPFIKIGRLIRIHRSTLERYAAGRTQVVER
jgi:excisionase family DNA binding protein